MTTALYEQPLGDERKYLKALATRYPGRIEFETGCGHIIHDLLARLPAVPQFENQKMALCKRIVDTVHPLAACLFAQSVHITLTMSDEPIRPPEVIAGLATYSAFDAESGVLRHGFLSAPTGVSYIEALAIPSGLGVLCEPLNLASHQFHDSTRDAVHNQIDVIWKWTERMVHAWYDQQGGQSNIPARLRLAASHGASLQALAATDAAAVAAFRTTTNVAAGVFAEKPADPPHRMTSAFIHEAGFAETAIQPRSQVNNPALRQPAPAASAPAPAQPVQTAKADPVNSPVKDNASPEAKHPDKHPHHDTPHPDVV
jgi:hypothetical protein